MKKFIAVLICMAVLAAAAFFYITELWTQSPYTEGQNYLVIGTDIITDVEEPLIENGNILLSFRTIKKYLDSNAFWDDKVQKVVFTTKDKIITMKTDKLTAMVNQKPFDLNVPARIVDNIPYIPIEFLEDMLNIQVGLVSDRIAVIDYNKDAVIIGELLENKGLKRDATIFSPYVSKSLKKGDQVRVFEQIDQWYKVRTADGVIGYIDGKYLNIIKATVKEPKTQEPAIEPFKPEKGKINMVWEHVINKNPDVRKLKPIE